MAEYIDRNTAIAKVTALEVIEPLSTMVDVRRLLADMPAADVTPVRHGRWEAMHYEGGVLDGTNFDKCSACGYERVFEDEKLKTAFNYCPKCGAKIESEG